MTRPRFASRPNVTVTSTRAGDGWQDQAACAGMATSLFFGDDAERVRAARERRAKAVCRSGCPVIDKCLAVALERHEVGVWGGTNETDRKRIRRQMTRRAAK